MSMPELKEYAKELIEEAKSKAIKLDLEREVFEKEDKRCYYEIDNQIYKSLNGRVYTEIWYAFIIENQLVFVKYTNRGTIKMFFTGSGYLWSISKGGRKSLDRATMKQDALRQLCVIAADCLSK
jgi:hypothetical protein